jgi:hypothetical protein
MCRCLRLPELPLIAYCVSDRALEPPRFFQRLETQLDQYTATWLTSGYAKPRKGLDSSISLAGSGIRFVGRPQLK